MYDMPFCPFLNEKGDRDQCGASDLAMKPSDLQMEKYCSTEEHYRCPILLVKTLTKGRKQRRPYVGTPTYA